jgi:MFS family permease
MTPTEPAGGPSARITIHRTVWILGFVSLLMDISTEVIQTLLPLYLVTVLGASVLVVGLIEGGAVAVATAVKFIAGYASDRMGHPKWIAGLGYGLAALSKPMFALATSATMIVGAKTVDRLGKGIRTAPRDALVAAVTPPDQLGRAFGLRKSLDTVGGFVGPLLAIGLMLVLAGDMRTIFWLAAIPAFLAVLLLVFGVRDEAPVEPAKAKPPDLSQAFALNRATWAVIGIALMIGLVRFSESFLVLKGLEAGVPAAWAPAAIVVLHLVFGLVAYPAGVLSDRLGRRGILIVSLIVLAAADLLLVLPAGPVGYFAGVALWGLHMGLSQGLLASLIADVAPRALRGSAFGVYALLSGLIALGGNIAAGGLWDRFGSDMTFGVAAALSAVCALALVAWSRRRRAPDAVTS